jgi:hypothetical protein|tara:strand:+ start:205 stop:381 length:177 start_codon:yes stop_codon:yes gene_type:complete
MTNKPIQENFDKQEIISGFIINLIKLTKQNIKLGKLSHREADNSLETFLGIEGAIKKQ